MMLQPCPQFPENNHNPAAMAPDDMTFLEWQRARLKQLQLQLHQSYFASTPTALDLCPNPFPAVHPPASTAAFHTCSDFGNQSVAAHELPGNTSPDLIHNPILGNSFLGGGEEGGGGGVVHELGGDGPSLLRTFSNFSCLPVAGDGEGKATPSAPAPPSDRGEGAAVAAAAIQYSAVDGGRENWRKRKAAHGATSQEPGSCYTDALLEPKLETPSISSTTITTTADGKDHKPTSTNREASSGDASKKKCSKVSDPSSKIDYIHVRARRGQATDSHSLAERARREKISKRMKLLQELVPGCSKISGKAGVLDEIINYVQSLQRQVEFLSMKLAAVNPILDSNNIDAFLMNKEMIPHCGGMVPSLVGTTLPLEPLDAAFLSHLNTMQTQQAVAPAVECSSLDQVAVNSSCPGEQAPLLQHLTPGAPLSVSEGCPVMDSYKVRALAATNPWEAHFDGLYTVYELQQLGLGVGAAPVIGDH